MGGKVSGNKSEREVIKKDIKLLWRGVSAEWCEVKVKKR